MTQNQLTPAVFLDRDGVINQALVRSGRPFPPKSIDELVITPEARSTFFTLSKAGYKLIGITNQPDVARGTQTREVVEQINALLLDQLPIEEIFVCYHDNNDQCNCRKPKPGLIIEAAQKYKIDLKNSYMIGDRWTDVEAGRRAGCKTFFIDYEYNEIKLDITPDYIIKNISEVMKWIIPVKN